MKKFLFRALLASLSTLGVVMTGCSNHEEDRPDTPKPDSPQQEEVADWVPTSLSLLGPATIEKANDFAFDLFKTTFSGTQDRNNLSLSPVSVYCTLAMMANGDDGAVRDELLQFLGYGSGKDELDRLNLFCNAFLNEVPTENERTVCTFTNSLWHLESISLYEDLQRVLKDVYGASVFPYAPCEERGRIAINEFVEEHTAGMIKEFLKQNIQSKIAFLNTTYFKGEWEKPFDKDRSYDYFFRNLDGSQSTTKYMQLADKLRTGQDGDLIGVSLPYSGNRYTMTLIKSAEETDFESFISKINKDRLRQLKTKFSEKEITLTLPKFETESRFDMDDIFKAMGLKKVYDLTIGFNKISYEKFALSDFKHAVKIIVDEEGTEAAGVSMGAVNDAISEDSFIRFDSPFIYLIEDNLSGSLLFIGAVTSL